MEQKPLLSIVTACRNAERTIARTLESVAEQRDVAEGLVEHWVIDGASTDRTLEIVNRFSHVQLLSEKDKGISDAFNRGVARAKGSWIQFLNGDDALASPSVLADILPELDAHYDFVYGRLSIMDENLSRELRVVGAVEGWRRLHQRMTLPHPSLFSHRRMFERYGLFDLQFHIAMDYEWLLRSYGSARFHFVPKTVVRFRSGGVSTSGQAARQAAECWRAKTKNAVGTPVARWVWFFYQFARLEIETKLSRWPRLKLIYERFANVFRRAY